MIPYIGDFAEDATVYIPFNTFDSNDPSASVTITNLAAGDVHVHKDGSTTQATTNGATVSVDFDTITGNHLITIDTSADAYYATGSDYLVRIEGTTVDGATINAWVGQFSIQNRYSAGALRPTTAGRTLDVTATGAAGIDWGNVENASTSVDLSATAINLCDTVTTNTDMRGTDSALLAASAPTNFGDLAITATTGLVSVGTNNDKTGYSISGTLTTLDALDTQQDAQHSTTQSAISGLNDPTAAAIADAVWDEAIAGHVGAGSTGEALNNATAPTAAAVADAVWDEALSGHLGAGSTGEALNAAGAAGDPWTTSLPGAYGAGSAGYIIGNNIDAAITSRPDAPTIADAVLDEALSGHTTAGTLGKVIGDYVNSSIADLRTVADGIQTDLSNGTDGLGAIKTAVDAIPTSNPTAAAIADAVLDEALAGHVTAGTLGKAVADIEADATLILEDTGTTIPASIAALNDLDAAAVRTAIGMAAANLDTQLSSLSTQASVDVIDGIVDAILVDTDTTIPALIAALNDLAASDILTTQLTESYAADGTAPTLSQAIFLIQQFLFERSVTGTTTTIKKLDGSTTAATLTLDNGTSPTSITRAS